MGTRRLVWTWGNELHPAPVMTRDIASPVPSKKIVLACSGIFALVNYVNQLRTEPLE